MKTFFCFIVVRPLTYSMSSASPPAAQPTLCVRLLLWSWAVNEKCRPAIIAKVWCVKTLIFALGAQEPGISANFLLVWCEADAIKTRFSAFLAVVKKHFRDVWMAAWAMSWTPHKGWVFVAVGSFLSHQIYCECNEPAYFVFYSFGEHLKSYILIEQLVTNSRHRE